MLQAIKNFFKREQHVHHHHNACSATTWRDMVVIALPDGRVFTIRHDYLIDQEVIQEMRLGY